MLGSMKSQNQRDLQKHWAEQAKKRTPAEQLRFKAEKLRRKIEQSKAPVNENGQQSDAMQPTVVGSETSAGKNRKKSR
jgi:hypothetical protein